jgi:ArsR family transcriptional regulator
MKKETNSAKRTEEQAALFKALADPTRLKLVKLLCRQGAQKALCVNALATRLGVTQSAVSQHLRILKNAGLVRGERRGYHVHYAADQEAMERTRSLLATVLSVEMSDKASI